MPYDPQVINAIIRIGRKRGMNREALLGALATGIVESGLTNIRGGDADSSGWRQERASLYPNPNNLNASINRFFNEWKQHDKPGFNPGLTAANVQRPAEQYRGRYADVMDEAKKVLGGNFPDSSNGDPQSVRIGDSPGSAVGPSLFASFAKQAPTENPIQQQIQKGWNLMDRLWQNQQGGGQQPNLPSLTDPKNAPLGRPGNGPIRKGLHEAFFDPVGGYDEGTSIGAIGGHGTHMHYGGNPAAIRRIVRLAQRPKWGFTVREYAPVDPVDPVHTEGSWHYKHGGRGGADISGGTTQQMAKFFRRVLRRAGWN